MRGCVGLRRVLVAFVLAGLSVGCGSRSRPGSEDSVESPMLVNLGETYRMYSIARNQPPKSLADLQKLQAMAGAEVEEARKGNIIVQWGAKLPDTKEEPGQTPSSEVLAYWKKVPEQGGYVLMLDRTVKKMTPEEFKAAPKAATQ